MTSFADIAVWFRPKAPRPRQNDLLRHEWDTLRILWETCKRDTAEAIAGAEVIDGAFPGPDDALVGPYRWEGLNLTEQRVGACLTPALLRAEFDILLQMARERSLPGLKTDADYTALFAAGAPVEAQRAAYMGLLYRLQSAFVETRFLRYLSGEVARRLLRYGLGASFAAIVVPALYVLYWYWVLSAPQDARHPAPIHTVYFDESLYSFALVITFGMLGAYFSRMIAFQGGTTSLSFNEAMAKYVGHMLRLRMLYGAIGAVILYLMLRANIIAGVIFPTLDDDSIAKRITGLVPAQKGAVHLASVTLFLPTINLAKLLVWSFIAGFSERLVPDSLAKAERAAA